MTWPEAFSNAVGYLSAAAAIIGFFYFIDKGMR